MERDHQRGQKKVPSLSLSNDGVRISWPRVRPGPHARLRVALEVRGRIVSALPPFCSICRALKFGMLLMNGVGALEPFCLTAAHVVVAVIACDSRRCAKRSNDQCNADPLHHSTPCKRI